MLVLSITGFAVATIAQGDKKEKKKDNFKTEKTKITEHVCTSACKDGKHMYAHGEKRRMK